MDALEKTVLSEYEINLCINAIVEGILKAHNDLDSVVLIGILDKGFPLAKRIQKAIFDKTQKRISVGKLDISLYRDDLISKGNFISLQETEILVDLNGKTVILVDDVLFHGRTIRAAMDGLMDLGRPARIEVAVLIDRGYRELPIYANFIGRTVPTEEKEHIQVRLYEIDGEDKVVLGHENH